MSKIVLLQRVLPAYREPLFEALRQQASAAGHDFQLWFSPASGDFARRGTEGTLSWAQSLPVTVLRTPLGTIEWQGLPWRDVVAAEVMIVSDNARHVSNLAAILIRRLIRKPVLTWGHGVNFQPNATSRLVAGLRVRLLRMAHGHLVYTPSCIDPLIKFGVDPKRIAVTDNAIDSTPAASLHSQHPDVLAFRVAHALGEKPCVAFLGSWYARKRPELIARFGEALRRLIPNAEILVIGGGDGLALLQTRQAPWLHLLGPLHGRDKYLALSVAQCLAVTGVAGLNVLDAMAVGLPVVVPARADHSPEIAYVRDGVNGWIVPDDIDQMAAACHRLLTDADLRQRMSEQARLTASRSDVQEVASRLLNSALRARDGQFGRTADE